MSTLPGVVVGLTKHDRVTCHCCLDGREFTGRITKIVKNQTDVRIEISCDYKEEPSHRICLNRSKTGWFTPYVEQREENEWKRYGRLVDLE